MVGTNKIVLDRLVLGERVDSPDALDLPLTLALAVLKDSRGVIDVALPLRGDLSNPQFDYGALIGKAIKSHAGQGGQGAVHPAGAPGRRQGDGLANGCLRPRQRAAADRADAKVCRSWRRP